MDKEDKKVLNGYGVLFYFILFFLFALFALCVPKASGKNPSEIIDLLNKDKL